MEQLDPHQKRVLYNLVEGVKEDKEIQTLGGYAGTGKTTLIKYLTKFFPKFRVCAYTGKAANVLRKKGIDASTIHSLIYQPVIEYGILTGFELADTLDDAEGIIVDEASMVSKDIFYDLEHFGLPMIFVGDHGQLEPVGSDFNLMENPDYTLEEIHRNAGDIAKFAEHIRKGYTPRSFRPSNPNKIVFLDKWSIAPEQMVKFDQVICAYNKTRVDTNNKIREVLGFSGKLNIGERIMCLKNNKKLELFNGMQGMVRDMYRKKGADRIDFEFDDMLFSGLKYSKNFFGVERPELNQMSPDAPSPFDYAYCITCHKAQGDEWPTGLVIEQRSSMWDHRRWAYTAASRFKEQVGWVSW